MEENKSNTTPFQFQQYIKPFPELIVGLSATCFILGLIIVNVHLSEYGITTSDFVRTEYVLTGGVYICLAAITLACMEFYLMGIRKATKMWKKRNYPIAVVGIILSFIVSIGPVILVLISITLNTITQDFWSLFGSTILEFAIAFVLLSFT